MNTPLSWLLRQLGIVLCLFTLTRILFYVYNIEFFSDFNFQLFLGGLRFDASIIIVLNSPLILFSLLPLNHRYSSVYWWIHRFLFVSLNGLGLALNLIDVAYFSFNKKRMSIELFQTKGIATDIMNVGTGFLIDYWVLFLIFLAILFALFKSVRKFPSKSNKTSWKNWVLYVVVIGCSIVIQRGGFQVKPLMPLHANYYAPADHAALILNTPFKVLKSIGKQTIQAKSYFSETELASLFSPIRYYYNKEEEIKKPNICLIILESFSHEYIGALHPEKTSQTPFLDHILPQSLYLTNNYANGLRSIESLPSILASIPSIIDKSYLNTIYATNNIKGLGSCLKELDYHTSFFHGGHNGTMGFNLFSRQSGFDRYFGKDEYNGLETDDDQHWGIYDEPFLQFCAQQLSLQPQPWASTIFTLSSHHPFKIPEKYDELFTKGKTPIENSIAYTDFALKRFFESAAKQAWFDNTIFVITADHTSQPQEKYYYLYTGAFRVPLFYYAPKLIEPDTLNTLSQHIDIMPTLLDYINYPDTFYAFGKSVYDSTAVREIVNRKSGYTVYQTDSLLCLFNNDTLSHIFKWRTDSICAQNIRSTLPEYLQRRKENQYKAILQTFTHDLIQNEMTYE